MAELDPGDIAALTNTVDQIPVRRQSSTVPLIQDLCTSVNSSFGQLPSTTVLVVPPKGALDNHSVHAFPGTRERERTIYFLSLLFLVKLPFQHSNTIIPILLKQTFLRNLAAGRHPQETDGFAANVLLACAVGRIEKLDDIRVARNGSKEKPVPIRTIVGFIALLSFRHVHPRN